MKKISLSDFAAQNKRPGRVCAACQSPHRDEIDAGLRAGIPHLTIKNWLDAIGVKGATLHNIHYHARLKHYVK